MDAGHVSAVRPDEGRDGEGLLRQARGLEPRQRLRHHGDREAVGERHAGRREGVVFRILVGIAPGVQELDLQRLRRDVAGQVPEVPQRPVRIVVAPVGVAVLEELVPVLVEVVVAEALSGRDVQVEHGLAAGRGLDAVEHAAQVPLRGSVRNLHAVNLEHPDAVPAQQAREHARVVGPVRVAALRAGVEPGAEPDPEPAGQGDDRAEAARQAGGVLRPEIRGGPDVLQVAAGDRVRLAPLLPAGVDLHVGQPEPGRGPHLGEQELLGDALRSAPVPPRVRQNHVVPVGAPRAGRLLPAAEREQRLVIAAGEDADDAAVCAGPLGLGDVAEAEPQAGHEDPVLGADEVTARIPELHVGAGRLLEHE